MAEWLMVRGKISMIIQNVFSEIVVPYEEWQLHGVGGCMYKETTVLILPCDRL